jgi:hypothetical protein
MREVSAMRQEHGEASAIDAFGDRAEEKADFA